MQTIQDRQLIQAWKRDLRSEQQLQPSCPPRVQQRASASLRQIIQTQRARR